MLALGRGEQRVRGGRAALPGAWTRRAQTRTPTVTRAAGAPLQGRASAGRRPREQTAARALVAALSCFRPLTVWATCWFPSSYALNTYS